MKETQEGCLSRSIIKYFEHFHSLNCSKYLHSLSKNEFFDKLKTGALKGSGKAVYKPGSETIPGRKIV